jgi:hypothetical protein
VAQATTAEYVEWRDSFVSAAGWKFIDDEEWGEAEFGIVIQSLGFVAYEDAIWLVLAADIDDQESAQNTFTSTNRRISIPKSTILNRYRIDLEVLKR